MRRILALTAALFGLSLVGCDSTGPERSVQSLIITGGNFQLDTVTHRLDNPLRVEAVDGAGLPVAGQLVCYVAATEGAGEPFLPCLETDLNGVGETPWTLGTLAGDHLAQARAMVDGVPTAVADYVLEAVPGPASVFAFPRETTEMIQSDSLIAPKDWVTDEYGNPVAWTFGGGDLATTGSDYNIIVPQAIGSGEATWTVDGANVARAGLDVWQNGQDGLGVTLSF